MTKIFLVLFFILLCSYLHLGKAEESKEKTENTTKDDDEDESASIQVVQRDIVTEKPNKSLEKEKQNKSLEKDKQNKSLEKDKQNKSLEKDKQNKSLEKEVDNSNEEETSTVVVIHKVANDTITTKAEAKYDAFFEDLINDSSEIALENRNDNTEEVSSPSAVTNEESNEFSNDQDKIAVSFEDITKAYKRNEKSKEDNVMIEDDEHDWRSAEKLHSDENKSVTEAANDDSAEDEKDYSTEDYMDKKINIEVKGRMETRQPERRQQFNTRTMNARRYGPSDSHGMLDSGPIRNYGEMVVPHYRPLLTRTGIVYRPNLYPMQPGTSLLDRLSARHNWLASRTHIYPEADALRQRHSRVLGVPQYEDSKMMDDYNDYGSNTNTYSYTPAKRVTTQAPPQQIVSPNKFDVFQKLVEASNHPKSQKRTAFSEFSGNYNPQRHYTESFGSYNVRRTR